MTSILRSSCHYLDGLKGAACADGVTSALPRTTEPPLFQVSIHCVYDHHHTASCNDIQCSLLVSLVLQRYVGLERFFALNSTCDQDREESAWKSIKVRTHLSAASSNDSMQLFTSLSGIPITETCHVARLVIIILIGVTS